MMKILAICESPRSENTYKSLKLIVELFPALEIEILSLMDLKLETCRGYYNCILNGEHLCPLKDDRDMILDKIIGAEGLILASPSYSQMVSAPIKNFFDRLGFLYHRPEFFGKFAMSMVTSFDYDTRSATAYINKMLCAFGFSMVPELELQFRPGMVQEALFQKNRKLCIAAMNTLIVKISKGEIDAPSLDMLIPFNIFKHVSRLDKNLMKADYEYYKDKGDYYYETQLGLTKKLIAQRISNKIIKQLH
jgi:multimeric flavodoxin WrbA